MINFYVVVGRQSESKKNRKKVEKVNVPITSPILLVAIRFWFYLIGKMMTFNILTSSLIKCLFD